MNAFSTINQKKLACFWNKESDVKTENTSDLIHGIMEHTKASKRSTVSGILIMRLINGNHFYELLRLTTNYIIKTK